MRYGMRWWCRNLGLCSRRYPLPVVATADALAAGSLLVIAADVVQAPNDKQQLEPMLGKLADLPDELGNVEALLADEPESWICDVAARATASHRGDHHAPPPPARTPRSPLTVAAVREPGGALVTVPDPGTIMHENMAARAVLSEPLSG
jgi:hypothetical protein